MGRLLKLLIVNLRYVYKMFHDIVPLKFNNDTSFIKL